MYLLSTLRRPPMLIPRGPRAVLDVSPRPWEPILLVGPTCIDVRGFLLVSSHFELRHTSEGGMPIESSTKTPEKIEHQ